MDLPDDVKIEEEKETDNSENSGCLGSLVLILMIPIAAFFVGTYVMRL